MSILQIIPFAVLFCVVQDMYLWSKKQVKDMYSIWQWRRKLARIKASKDKPLEFLEK